MTLTQKETDLLKDAKGQEELCIKKYDSYAKMAKSEELRNLFTSMSKVEQNHLQTICAMMNGNVSAPSGTTENSNKDYCSVGNYSNEEDRQADAFLCQDMLATEKHVSSLYNTSVFEFKDPTARKVLNHIQTEEQQHGEKIYAYMSCNGMYS